MIRRQGPLTRVSIESTGLSRAAFVRPWMRGLDEDVELGHQLNAQHCELLVEDVSRFGPLGDFVCQGSLMGQDRMRCLLLRPGGWKMERRSRVASPQSGVRCGWDLSSMDPVGC